MTRSMESATWKTTMDLPARPLRRRVAEEAASLSAGVDVGASGLPCGGEAEEDSSEDGDCGGEGEDAEVKTGVEGRGTPGGGEQVGNDVATEVAEGETGDASERGEEEAFG